MSNGRLDGLVNGRHDGRVNGHRHEHLHGRLDTLVIRGEDGQTPVKTEGP